MLVLVNPSLLGLLVHQQYDSKQLRCVSPSSALCPGLALGSLCWSCKISFCFYHLYDSFEHTWLTGLVNIPSKNWMLNILNAYLFAFSWNSFSHSEVHMKSVFLLQHPKRHYLLVTQCSGCVDILRQNCPFPLAMYVDTSHSEIYSKSMCKLGCYPFV